MGRDKISVCHLASGDRWAGAEVQLATLLRAFALRGEFHLSAIFLNDGQLAEEARQCGVKVKIITESQKGFIGILLEATEYLRGRGIHILHSHGYKQNVLAALLRWRCPIPFLVRSQHGLPEPFGRWKHRKQWLVRHVDRAVARYATDRVISVSSELRDYLAHYLDPSKITLIHNGIDVERVRSSLSSQAAKERLGISTNCRVIGTAGRLEPIKRLDLFLQAAGRIAERVSDSRFVIVGEGSEAARLHEMARRNGLHNKVFFLGHRGDIFDVLRAIDIFVLSSDHEGLPMVLLEALCLGVPVVARTVGGIAEVIEDGVSGILVDSADPGALANACLSVLGDDAQQERLALEGVRRVARKFTAARTAEAVANLYYSLCQPRGVPLPGGSSLGSRAKQMRVGFVSALDYPHVGEVRPRKLAQSLHQAGHQTVFLSWNSRRRATTEDLGYARVHRFSYFLNSRLFSLLSAPSPLNFFWTLWIAQIAKRERLDVLISSNIRLALPATLAARAVGISIVLDLQENNREAVRIRSKDRFHHYLSRNAWLVGALENLCVELADRTWVVVEERIGSLPLRPRQQGRISVVCHTPGLDELKPATQGSSKERKNFTLVYMGLFAPAVGSVEPILAALTYVLERDKNVRVLIGGGYQLVPLVEKFGLQDYVRFDGVIPPEKVPAWLQQGDLGIIGYRVNPCTNTTVSNKLFHYMAAGLPVLSTDMAPTRRIIEECRCGRIIPLGSTPEQIAELILELKNSPQERAAMGGRGRQAILQKYNWDVDFALALSCLEDLVANDEEGLGKRSA